MLLVPIGRHLQQHRLIEMLGLWQILLEEPALDRRERHWSDYLCLLLPLVGGKPRPYGPRWIPHRFHYHCQLSNRLVLEELFGGQVPTCLASTCNDLHTENGVASQCKEVVIAAHQIHT